MDESTAVVQSLSCPFHPESKETTDFYLYENKKPLCKACVKKRHTDWYQKHKNAKNDDNEKTDTTTLTTTKITKHNFLKGPDEPEHKDAWGPYLGESADTIRRRKRMRGMAFCSQSAWRSKDEVELAEKQALESQQTQTSTDSKVEY